MDGLAYSIITRYLVVIPVRHDSVLPPRCRNVNTYLEYNRAGKFCDTCHKITKKALKTSGLREFSAKSLKTLALVHF